VSGREGEEERSVSELQKKEKKRGRGSFDWRAEEENRGRIYINDERVWRLLADGWDVAELHFPRGLTCHTWHVMIPMFYFSRYFIYIYIYIYMYTRVDQGDRPSTPKNLLYSL
jgi:hypothetical protein